MRKILFGSIAFIAFYLLGCAGVGMLRTEADYKPTHVAVGEVYAYNISQGLKNEDLVNLFNKFVEEALYDMDVRYIPMKELESTPVPPESTVMMDMEISFQKGRIGVDVLVNYTIRRRSDKMVWFNGSARASEMPNSESALYDRTTGLQFAAKSVVSEVISELAKEPASE